MYSILNNESQDSETITANGDNLFVAFNLSMTEINKNKIENERLVIHHFIYSKIYTRHSLFWYQSKGTEKTEYNEKATISLYHKSLEIIYKLLVIRDVVWGNVFLK